MAANSRVIEMSPPQSLDVETWAEVSKKSMAERRRVSQGRENVWRKSPPQPSTVNSGFSWDLLAQLHRVGLNLFSVNPAHQRKGVGSLLLRWGYGQADTGGQDMSLLASPAWIKLYENLDLELSAASKRKTISSRVC